MLVQFFCTVNFVISALAMQLHANGRCQVRAGWDREREERHFVSRELGSGTAPVC